MPTAPAFNMPNKGRVIEVFKADLKAAAIPYMDEAGRYAGFHVLRHTCGSWLAAAGVHPKIIQRIMRHSTITLTMDRYTHAFKSDGIEAVAKLPDLSCPGDHAALATGTHVTDPTNFAGAFRGAMGGKQWTEKPGHVDSTVCDEKGIRIKKNI